MRILVACEFSGVVRDAFLARGHDAWSCDLLPTEVEGPHYQGDVRDLLDYPWDLMKIPVDTAALLCNDDCMKTLQIGGFEAYRIRDDGVLETNWRWGAFYPGMPCADKWKALPFRETPEGYRAVHLRNALGKSRRTHIHRLVAEAFVGPAPFPNACVRHLDGNTRNNLPANLAWGTYQENEDDKRQHGTWNRRVSNAKLSPETMRIARQRRKEGKNNLEIAREIGVTRSTISRFLGGRTWK
jgi:hypothetical protein